MLIRLSKILLLAASGLFLALVVFNNLTDVQSNWQFVKHVLSMDALKWETATQWRAITSPFIHGLFFASIIYWEAAAGVLCARAP
jgi:predicted small integral membrane protein